MTHFILVGIGGGCGAMARFAFLLLMKKIFMNQHIPYATIFVNAVGSLLIGLLAGFLETKIPGNEPAKLFLIVGILGGFTTFSTFSLETLTLIKNAQMHLAFFNIFIHIITCLFAVWMGFSLSKSF